ncbi:MAG: GxxExxY protein [Ardenticatenaceae bacterium]|nr:GxxExxY protein [Ardenticatenaceae bacterium]
MREPLRNEDKMTEKIIGAAIEVHRHLGPGLLESAYQVCLAHEMTLRGIRFEREKPLPVVYKSVHLDQGYRLDFLVEGLIIVELKSVKQLTDIHYAQLLSYLKLSDLKLGLLLNFNVLRLKNGGIKRVANNL